MRTAVAAIKKLTPGEDPLLRSSVSIVDRSITRCDNIIGDLLDYSRVRPMERESTDADAWLASLLDEYQLPAGVTLRRDLAPGARLTIDHDRLRRALINVIDNACQAMAGQSTDNAGEREHILTVAATEAAGRCEIAIDDTGSGIARDDQKQIFEPLYSTNSFGVGLGLPLVKRVVEQHDGTVEVESEPGKGTRFVIRLPLAAAQSAPAA
jgi:signal transduction histidine kinase